MWAKGLGIVGFITGGIDLLQLKWGGLVQIGIGALFFIAGQHFSKVVDTQGNDIHNMMQALDKVKVAFTIKLVIVGLALVLMLCAVIAVLAVGVSSM
jgi:hypothetical protein